MNDRYVSAPLLHLLTVAQISPSAVHASIVKARTSNQHLRLRPGHVFLQRIHEASGLNVIEIALRYGRLLMTIEQLKDRRISWFYNEYKGSLCAFRCPAQVPEATLIAARGRPLQTIVDLPAPLGAVKIIGIDEEHGHNGTVSLKLAPDWVAF